MQVVSFSSFGCIKSVSVNRKITVADKQIHVGILLHHPWYQILMKGKSVVVQSVILGSKLKKVTNKHGFATAATKSYNVAFGNVTDAS